MEHALAQIHPPVPYQRIAALRGTRNASECVSHLQQITRCFGLSGLARTVVHIMEERTSVSSPEKGLTMILEDDFVIAPNRTQWESAIQQVPEDWDIIRLVSGCPRPTTTTTMTLVQDVNSTVPIYKVGEQSRVGHGICCGTHAQIWRPSSLYKLHKLWSRRPYDDIDCALSRSNLVSSSNTTTSNRLPLRSYMIGLMNHGPSRALLGYLHAPVGEQTVIQKKPVVDAWKEWNNPSTEVDEQKAYTTKRQRKQRTTNQETTTKS